MATPQFSRFRNLPLEIRIMIWKKALPNGRLVFLEPKLLKCDRQEAAEAYDKPGTAADMEDPDDEDDIEDRSDYYRSYEAITHMERRWGHWRKSRRGGRADFRYGLRSECPVPALLLVCKESFGVASKFYKKAFHTVNSKPETWFDFEIDTLYIRLQDLRFLWAYENNKKIIVGYSPPEFVVRHSKELQKVQKLALLRDLQYLRQLGEMTCLGQLFRVFTGIKWLYLVEKHHPRQDSDESQYLLINEPMAFEESFKRFALFRKELDVWNHSPVLPAIAYLPDDPDQAPHSIGRNLLQRHHFKPIASHFHGGSFFWVPSYSEAVVVTQKTKEALDAEIRSCEELILKYAEQRVDMRRARDEMALRERKEQESIDALLQELRAPKGWQAWDDLCFEDKRQREEEINRMRNEIAQQEREEQESMEAMLEDFRSSTGWQAWEYHVPDY